MTTSTLPYIPTHHKHPKNPPPNPQPTPTPNTTNLPPCHPTTLPLPFHGLRDGTLAPEPFIGIGITREAGGVKPICGTRPSTPPVCRAPEGRGGPVMTLPGATNLKRLQPKMMWKKNINTKEKLPKVIFCWGFWGFSGSAEGILDRKRWIIPGDHYRSVFWRWTFAQSEKETGAIRGVSQQKRCKTTTMIEKNNWLVVSTPLKNIRQNGNLPQVGMKIKNIWNHHLDNNSVMTADVIFFNRIVCGLFCFVCHGWLQIPFLTLFLPGGRLQGIMMQGEMGSTWFLFKQIHPGPRYDLQDCLWILFWQ